MRESSSFPALSCAPAKKETSAIWKCILQTWDRALFPITPAA